MDSLPPDILRRIMSGPYANRTALLVYVNKRLKDVFAQPLKDWMLEVQRTRRELHAYGETLMHKYCEPREPIRVVNGVSLTTFRLISTALSDRTVEFDTYIHLDSPHNSIGPYYNLEIRAYPRTAVSGMLDITYQSQHYPARRTYVRITIGYIHGIPAALVARGVV